MAKQKKVACAIFLVILNLHALVSATIVYGSIKTFRKVLVSAATLEGSATKEILPGISSNALSCAIRASVREWSYLACQVNYQCYLYDLQLAPNHEDATQDVVDCFSKPIKVCQQNDDIYVEGDISVNVRDCKHMVCQNGTQKEYTGETSIPLCKDGAFQCAVGIGCIRIIALSYTYDSAKSYCINANSRLVVPYDIPTFHSYMQTKPLGHYWVGIEERKWLDGSKVDMQYWLPNQAMTPGSPGKYYTSQSYLFTDQSSTTGSHFICQEY